MCARFEQAQRIFSPFSGTSAKEETSATLFIFPQKLVWIDLPHQCPRQALSIPLPLRLPHDRFMLKSHPSHHDAPHPFAPPLLTAQRRRYLRLPPLSSFLSSSSRWVPSRSSMHVLASSYLRTASLSVPSSLCSSGTMYMDSSGNLHLKLGVIAIWRI